jgi:hypothetical protein
LFHHFNCSSANYLEGVVADLIQQALDEQWVEPFDEDLAEAPASWLWRVVVGTVIFALSDFSLDLMGFSLAVKSVHKRIAVLLDFSFRSRWYFYKLAPFGATLSDHYWSQPGEFSLPCSFCRILCFWHKLAHCRGMTSLCFWTD